MVSKFSVQNVSMVTGVPCHKCHQQKVSGTREVAVEVVSDGSHQILRVNLCEDCLHISREAEQPTPKRSDSDDKPRHTAKRSRKA